MDFTFLTITYNHEKFILEHLESIKYQIINFGKKKDFQLVIADDCSKDRTIVLIKKWIGCNGGLFKDINILENDKNLGTCKNYANGIRHIKGKFYKSLAGDDIFGKDNIFETVKLLEQFDIVVTPTGEINSSGIFVDKKIYSRIYSMFKFINTDYKRLSNEYAPIPMTPGVFMRKELLTESVLEFIEKFNLIEDRSSTIKLYENNKKMKFGLYEKIVVLYRHHDMAITKTKDVSINSKYVDDSIRLSNYVKGKSNSKWLKIRMEYHKFLIKIKNNKLALLLNFDVWFYRISFLLNYPKYKNNMEKIIEESFLPNEEYLQYIRSEAKKYE
ncbi:MAG: glycosyltransferase family 2 protein [Candidatus Ozemobacteraceae bacterium]